MHAQLPALWGPLGGEVVFLWPQRSPVASESWPLFLCKHLLFPQTNGGFSIYTKGRARTVPPESELRATVDLGWGWGSIRGWGRNQSQAGTSCPEAQPECHKPQPEEGGNWKWLSLKQGSLPLNTADMAILGTVGC